MFDNATSCSSENSVIAVAAIAEPLLAALTAAGGARLEAAEASQLERAMFVDGRPGSSFVAQGAPAIALRAGLSRASLLDAGFLIVEETGVGPEHPFSGEKLSPVLTFYRVAQETLNNVIKHAHATRVDVRLMIAVDAGELRIRDNGSGFKADTASVGIGLNNMRERAAGIGAVHQIQSEPGRGTEMLLKWTSHQGIGGAQASANVI